MEIIWSEFKKAVDERGLSIQYIVHQGNYLLKAIDGAFILDCSLPIGVGDADTTDFETNYKANGNRSPSSSLSAFSSKTYGSKKLYKRVTGIKTPVIVGPNEIVYTIPFPWIKITGIEFTNGSVLDTVSLSVLDTASGTTYTGYPNNTVLNQFGYTVNISKDYYSYKSEFDADLYQNMQIKLIYDSTTIKTIGINFILTEVK